jgi:hypothetical protein
MATFGTFQAGQILTAAELNTAGFYDDFTPTWSQSATITKTVNWARFTQLNKIVMGSIKMTSSSAGTANTQVLVTLPVAASANNFIIGSMSFLDDSSETKLSQTVSAYYQSSTTMSFSPWLFPEGSPAYLGSNLSGASVATKRFGENFTGGNATNYTGLTVASGDIIYVQFMYEAA